MHMNHMKKIVLPFCLFLLVTLTMVSRTGAQISQPEPQQDQSYLLESQLIQMDQILERCDDLEHRTSLLAIFLAVSFVINFGLILFVLFRVRKTQNR